ncbi:beta-1,3-galactosyltransferase 5-like [Patella vulgata]|uniref:beta-1,3-galactosyltransferase 5-like n=1 Tax=Patella vulgata TaxID=6465 RepID=UPI0024A7A6CC|nr:beta-1,3-galactosyltransferase 5-like [Patella vulgata]
MFISFKSIRNLEYERGHSTDAPTANYIQVPGENSSVEKFSSCSRDASLIAFDKRKNPIFDGEYLLNNKSICCGPTPITAIVVVHTDPHHFGRRQNVRETYGSRELFLPTEIRVIFLLGRVKTLEMQNKVLRENSQYGDIIQGNFIDAYHNLTLKAVMGLHWVSNFCSKVKYVIKTDDDAIFDMWRFLKQFHAKNLYVSKTIYGISKSRDRILRSGKWGIDKTFFKGQKIYPFKFCIGFFLIYSSDVIPALYRESYVVPFLWLDDVYVTGMLRTAANGIEIVDRGGNLSIVPGSSTGFKCLQERGDECPYLAVGSNENIFHVMWELIMKRNHK